MAEYLSPGVYVEEYDNAPRRMEGVGTSTAGFVGLAERGSTTGAPVLVTNYGEFVSRFGGSLSEFEFGEYRYLAGAVEQFFINGGTRCYVARVIPDDAKAAEFDNGLLKVTAVNEGSWGNHIELEMFDTGLVMENGTSHFGLKIQVRCQDTVEVFEGVSLDPESENEIGRRLKFSELIRLEVDYSVLLKQQEKKSSVEQLLGENENRVVLSGGSDGTKDMVTAETFMGEDKGPGARTGIQAFLENHIVSLMAVPGITMPDVMVSLIEHCENTGSRFAVLDMPKELSNLKELIEYRKLVDTTYAAMYHPWLQNYDRSSRKPVYFPPSGAVLGVYSRADISRGVHKAPANETVSCTGLNINFSKKEQDILNPEGINLIRALPGQGIQVWGARTAGSNTSFRYINIRRLFIYVEESIKANTNWVMFEQNDAVLWNRVRQSVSGFLDTMWRRGMFAGATPAESYFVDIGPSTMTADDIRNGRLICNIGIAPSRPAEFIILRVIQYTAKAETLTGLRGKDENKKSI